MSFSSGPGLLNKLPTIRGDFARGVDVLGCERSVIWWFQGFFLYSYLPVYYNYI